MNTVIVTCFNRPECLAVCLEHISLCDLSDLKVVISEDCRERPLQVVYEMCEVIRGFNFDYISRFDCRNIYDNGWRALSEAQDSDFVFHIEDDVAVEQDFFRWHLTVQEQFKPFVSCGNNRWSKIGQYANEVGLSHSDFSTQACCIPKQTLQSILSRQDRHFEEALQNKMIENKYSVVFPLRPRAYDMGIQGVNLVGFKPTGTLDERIRQVRQGVKLSHPETRGSLKIGLDRRPLWEKAYEAQAKWGF